MTLIDSSTWLRIQGEDRQWIGYARARDLISITAKPLKHGRLSARSAWELMNVQACHALHTDDIRSAVALSIDEQRALGLGPAPHWDQGRWTHEELWRVDARLALHSADDVEALMPHGPHDQLRLDSVWVRLHKTEPQIGAYWGTCLSGPSAQQEVLVRPTLGSPLGWCLSPETHENLKYWSGGCPHCGFDLMIRPWRERCEAPEGVSPKIIHDNCILCGTPIFTIPV